jgi:hypothetical protein
LVAALALPAVATARPVRAQAIGNIKIDAN